MVLTSPMPIRGRACGHPRPGSWLHSKASARHVRGTRVSHRALAQEPRGPVQSSRDPSSPLLCLGPVVRCQALFPLHTHTCLAFSAQPLPGETPVGPPAWFPARMFVLGAISWTVPSATALPSRLQPAAPAHAASTGLRPSRLLPRRCSWLPAAAVVGLLSPCLLQDGPSQLRFVLFNWLQRVPL